MPDHRKTPVSSALTIPLWAIVATIVLCLGAAGYLGYLVWDDQTSDTASPAAERTTSAPTTTAPVETVATPSPSPSASATPPAASPSTAATTAPPVARRTAVVAVFNQSGVRGRAASSASIIRQKGWTVSAIGNWRGAVPSTTIYFPESLETQAELLGHDVGIDRVLPRASSMRSDRLTVVLVGAL